MELRPTGFRSDFEPENASIIRQVQPYTMTTPDRVYALIQAVRYIAENDINGSIVECGAWRGGSMMAAALMLQRYQKRDIDIYLYDTFEGMPPPEIHDVDSRGKDAASQLAETPRSRDSTLWAYAPLDDVRENLARTGYDDSRFHFIKGKVEDTLPSQAPDGPIALLRLDTDWYASTKHELQHLYPQLAPGGVLILDDYGWWKGSKQAYDEYAKENDVRILLNRIDNAGRIAIKTV
jgi:O-methyltransferase